MKNKIFLTIAIVFTSVLTLSSQVLLEDGFSMLESQAYDEAAEFFGAVLSTEPENKTARICYGRALGLGGDTNKGLEVFTALRKDYPADYEVELNVAEAYMWQKEYEQAYQVYQTLLDIDSSNYVANLGFANANASLNKNDIALCYINKAISLSTNNGGALISKKYILLALAERARKDWEYEKSHVFLDTLSELYPKDKDILLTRAAVYLSNQEVNLAKDTYQEMLDEELAILDATVGLSYTSLLNNNIKECLVYAQQATALASSSGVQGEQYLRVAINEVNALAVARKYSEANVLLDELDIAYPNATDVKLAKARIKVWGKEAKDGLAMYQALGEDMPESFDLYMGQAEAYRSLKERSKAISLIEKALALQPRQPDAHRLLDEIKSEKRAVLAVDALSSTDVGGNNAQVGRVFFEVGAGDKHRIFTQYQYRQAMQQREGVESNQQVLLIGDRWQVNANLILEGSAGKVFGSSLENTYNTNLVNAGGRFQFWKYHEFGLKYMREAHNYTVDLINSGIVMNNLQASYAYSSPGGFGAYSHYINTTQTDGNGRDLIFSSLYFNFKNNPLYKIGTNLSLLKYDFQSSDLYFSPDDLRSGELFFETGNLNRRKGPFSYHLLIAVGKQKVIGQEIQDTRRIEFLVGYNLMKQLQVETYFKNNNAAQANAIGFSITNYGVRCRMFL